MNPGDIPPPLDDHGNLQPAFIAHVDQCRAQTRERVDQLVQRFRTHADEAHGGDQICSHAITAFSLLTFGHPMAVADLAAGAIARIVQLEAEVERLGAVISQYQTAAQDSGRDA